ncbi:hypothetical protein A1sIIB106_06800 [Candidatus Planktophila lacus]|uniref:LmeA family phospholipid-binding protein n=1 Tax=Candidatus Planktophila lacus TaxID=1884913 RepID=UPI000BACC505|nr:LmeA family phospholipid-binding protein [Candidatus Planktophila lacus]ASY25672.1 hypothetical protein A1sIIB106_06800 [Candidatus Planktophila lacus]ASY29636.1 hypothetical protein A1sIIB60_06910 [Candidatus Planktophila lacus]
MKRKKSAVIVATTVLVLLGTAALAAESAVSSKIESRVQQQLPSASGISASVPLTDLPSILNSDLIKEVKIDIADYTLKSSGRKSSIEISAKEISKSSSTRIGSLEIKTTVAISQLLAESGFNDAEIVDNALQISVGAGGLGKALIVPQYSNNQIYLQIKSVSIMGSPIPASSLPADIQEQIKSRTVKDLRVPAGLKVKSVSIGPKGLSVSFQGTNINLRSLALSL